MNPLFATSLITTALALSPVGALSQTWAPTAEDASSAAVLSGFAASVIILDDEILVGRPGGVSMFPMPPNRPGAVHVFRLQGDEFIETQALAPEEIEVGYNFGASLDVAQDVLVVGAPDEGTGAAYVYRRDTDGWSFETRLEWSDGGPGARFGAAVATNGDALMIGAPGAFAGNGSAVVFASEGGSWAEVDVLAGEGLPDGSSFGSAVSMDGGTAAVGAPGGGLSMIPGTPQPALLPGAVLVFEAGSAGWEESARLEPSTPGPASLGWNVAVAGDRVYGSAPLAEGFTGAVYEYTRDGTEWSLTQTIQPDSPAPQSGFGMSMAMAGGDLVVGTPLSGGGLGGGYAFRADGAEWQEVAQFGPGGPFGFYGLASAVGGDWAVVGAPGADFFEGTGFLFRRTADGWDENGTLVDENSGMDALLGEELECEEGSAGGFGCSEVDLVSFVPVQALGASRGIIANDVWGWTDPETGSEYAIVGRADATTFVDLSNPERPIYLGELPLTEGATPNMWRDIKVYANHAYIVSDGAGPHGVQIFDLTQLRDVSSPPVTFEETAHYDRIFSAHNIVMNEETGFAYVVGASGGGETCGGGLHMIDVRDPANPVFAGCFADASTGNAGTGYSHDAQCIEYHGPDEAYQGHEICFGANENALSISDVTDKDAPVPVSTASYPNTGYLHQGWVTDDHRYFYMNDEADELAGSVSRTRTLIWDIEDLEDPVLVKEHFGTTAASDHNLYVHGDFMYQANYVSGLRILDVSDPENPEEVGFFDTVPAGDDAPGFAGAWSTYPYFESGLIIVTSMREGLFVLRKRPPPVS